MKAKNRSLKMTVLSCAVASGALHSALAVASLDIADEPLFMGINADPNIMFILDDSGSMHWEYMPNEVSGSGPGAVMFPQPGGVYGGADYRLGCGGGNPRYYAVPTFSDTNAYNLTLRSPDFNKAFYNPDLEYEPWYNSDGTQMADSPTTGAYYNPANTALGGLNLTVEQTTNNNAFWYYGTTTTGYTWQSYSCASASTYSYWPVTYYLYKGGSLDQNVASSYDKVQITSSTASSATFTSPNGTVRTRDEEIQNFANWFTYYRSRLLLARSGIGAAFATQGEDLRVGYATINQGSSTVDGVSTSTVVNGVRSFAGTDRTNFFSELYGRTVGTSITPLRRALDDVGQYFSRTDNRGPWGATPGTNDTTDHIQCRKSYSILMTDGYWTWSSPTDYYQASTADARNNNDGADGPAHANPVSDNYVERSNGSNYSSYLTSNPFTDSYTNTLADVAMYYWKNDLRPDLDNKIIVSEAGDAIQEIGNPAYWQHMVTFGVGLGVSGNLDSDAVYQAVKDETAVSWSNPFDTDPAKIDDLLHASINSRGGFFSASDPAQFAADLKGVLDTIASDVSSSSSAVANTTRLDTDTLVYQAKFDPGNWSGQLLAYTVSTDGVVDIDDPEWDADDELPAHGSRKIFTFIPGSGDGTGGVEFLWDNLSDDQKDELNDDIYGVTDNLGQDRVSFLRGDTSVTGPASAPFRDRTSTSDDDTDGYDILGDIVNSDPIFVGTADFGFGRASSGLTDAEKSAYNTFRSSTSYAERDGMVYIGANDGMFHGFNASTGAEEFAFIPNSVYPKLSALTSAEYAHQYYIDATAHMSDVYIDSGWKTMIASSLGAGGRALFALDVTDPDGMGVGDIMWEVEANDADATLKHLGYMLGKPQIVRAQNGQWLILVGNGYNSADHQAVLFVLDASDGSVITTINTGVGSSSEPNGLSTPLAVDVDGDKVLDTVYAGDLHGNLWKFDFSASNSNRWDVAITQGSNNLPLFQACDGASCTSSTRQPITTQPTISPHEQGVMVLFGTGKYFENSDAVVGSSPRTEGVYGIFDCGAVNNNQLCGSTVAKSELVEQAILVEDDNGTTSQLDDDVRVSSDYEVEVSNSVKGWFMQLKPPGASHGSGERVVANPIIVNEAVLFITFTPDSDPCNFGGSSWLMEMDPESGARFETPILDYNEDGVIDDNDYYELPGGDKVAISGKRDDEKRSTPGILHGAGEDGKLVLKIQSGSSGSIGIELNKGVNNAGRQSWRQLR